MFQRWPFSDFMNIFNPTLQQLAEADSMVRHWCRLGSVYTKMTVEFRLKLFQPISFVNVKNGFLHLRWNHGRNVKKGSSTSSKCPNKHSTHLRVSTAMLLLCDHSHAHGELEEFSCTQHIPCWVFWTKKYVLASLSNVRLWLKLGKAKNVDLSFFMFFLLLWSFCGRC